MKRFFSALRLSVLIVALTTSSIAFGQLPNQPPSPPLAGGAPTMPSEMDILRMQRDQNAALAAEFQMKLTITTSQLEAVTRQLSEARTELDKVKNGSASTPTSRGGSTSLETPR